MDRTLTITVGQNRKSKTWQRDEVTWQQLLRYLEQPITGSETYYDYMSMPKPQQDELKDVGGYVGGTFKSNRRLSQDLTGRDLITIDLDNIPKQGTDDVIAAVRNLRYKACVHSTRKHSERNPRLRVILPLDRTVEPDEYEPIARYVCNEIGMDWADPTTFDPSRLMYWPSISKDSEYVFEVMGGDDVPADWILNTYDDWREPSNWPTIAGFEAHMKSTMATQEDPLRKSGLIGAFCKCYTIQEAMDTFLPGLYEETMDPNRRTYTGGSTYGGVVIYDDKFVYSHHATDAISCKLCNAWDMVRIHIYGELDETAKDGTPMAKKPSFIEMARMAKEDRKVKDLLAEQRAKEVAEAFKAEGDDITDMSWLKKLTLNKHDDYEKTIENFVIILDNDPILKGKIAVERFANKEVIKERVPWDKAGLKYPRMIADSDVSHIMNYIEKRYRGLYSKDKIQNALNIVGANNAYNVIEDYLNSLVWDRIPRVDTLLTDYLGARDTVYTRAVIRKTLIAAAKRAIAKESVKFDPMPILIGEQGIGKSTFIRYLAVNESWYDESLNTFEGKDAAEHIQGSWIVEIGELAAMSKQELSSVKSFQTRTTDRFRQAYGHHTMEYVRRCIFIGTTNDEEFLRDTTGNRRFWPVETRIAKPTKRVFTDLEKEVDQIWAEVMCLVRADSEKSLDMDTEELKELSFKAQEAHRVGSSMEGIISDFMDEMIPVRWRDMDALERSMWKSSPNPNTKTKQRDRVCVEEIWTDALGKPRGTCPAQKQVEIRNALAAVAKRKGWEKKTSVRFGCNLGTQRGYVRKEID